jgi:hypothetical protein
VTASTATTRIELVPSRDGRFHVTTTRRWSLWAPTARHTEAGGVLTLTGDCPPPGSLGITRCAVDQRVSVPAGTSIRVTANTGNLTATDLAVVSFEAQASRGSLSASFVRPPDRTLVRLDAGSVRLTVPAASYALDATVPAQAGHLTVEVPNDPAAPRQISAHISRSDLQILRRYERVHKFCSFLDEGDLRSKPSPTDRGSLELAATCPAGSPRGVPASA